MTTTPSPAPTPARGVDDHGARQAEQVRRVLAATHHAATTRTTQARAVPEHPPANPQHTTQTQTQARVLVPTLPGLGGPDQDRTQVTSRPRIGPDPRHSASVLVSEVTHDLTWDPDTGPAVHPTTPPHHATITGAVRAGWWRVDHYRWSLAQGLGHHTYPTLPDAARAAVTHTTGHPHPGPIPDPETAGPCCWWCCTDCDHDDPTDDPTDRVGPS